MAGTMQASGQRVMQDATKSLSPRAVRSLAMESNSAFTIPTGAKINYEITEEKKL